MDKIVTGLNNYPLNVWNRVDIGNIYAYLSTLTTLSG